VLCEPTWVEIETLLAIHQQQIAEHGGLPGVRDLTLLEAAIARPKQLYAYEEPVPNIERLAVAYGYGLICNHPFVDGNKRTGLIALGIFLELNGRELTGPPTEMYKAIVQAAAGNWSEEALIAWVSQHTQSTNPL
jgi:death on curing protein